MIRPPHPFPARMAPELAIKALEKLPSNSTILDPMAGSGVVLRHAIQLGHTAIGYDLDPLAVLMSSVWINHIEIGSLVEFGNEVINKAKTSKTNLYELPWVDEETRAFIKFWYAEKQLSDLSKVALILHKIGESPIKAKKRNLLNALRLSLSRIIITKSGGASLANDTSHSRPHRTRTESDFDVFEGLRAAIKKVESVCSSVPHSSLANVKLGDARDLRGVRSSTVDAIISSPPYLNAIDYMRGHKLALVWLGYPISNLSNIRRGSIGAERIASLKSSKIDLESIKSEMIHGDTLSSRQIGMIERYIFDLDKLTTRASRVLRTGGKATYVVGNSCLNGTFISNSNCLRSLSLNHGLILVDEVQRELPENKRYLPVGGKKDNPLKKRIRVETILTFQKVA